MKISQKLLIIVCLTVLEVSITVWATFQISKGARLHQLNSLHLKHNAIFSALVTKAENGGDVGLEELRQAVLAIRDQPIAGNALIGPLDHVVMNIIGTEYALDLIDKDIDDTERALSAIDSRAAGVVSDEQMVSVLKWAAAEFNANSSRFEAPVTRTVAFMLQMMIPMIVIISLFNICFITYLSRSISSSIKSLIQLLRSGKADHRSDGELSHNVSGELRELMQVAEERLRAELMNLETNEELRQLIEDRTRSLQEARNEAQASLEAKERFLANMSHEIRTPINGILCAADLVLQDLDENDPHFEFNSIIQDSADSLLRILNDILDFSKIESGKLSLETVPFDVGVAIDQVVSLMRPQAEGKGLSFRLSSELAETDRRVEGDPTRIRQILINLLSNAMKFTEEGEVSLAVEMRPGDEGDGRLRIVISDTGIGMTAEQLVRLFDRFEQADDSTTRKYGGTGLGLSLSREIALLMGGDITVKSELGVGTRFCLELPLSRSGAAPEIGSRTEREERDYGGARVLLVEDNRVNQRVATKVLERLGLEVTLAENGAAALERVDEGIEVVLMDVQMPVMDGIQATKELRAGGWTRPIIALTANVFENDRQRYEEAGMTGFLAKPMRLPDLMAELDRHLAPDQRRAA